MTKLVTENSGVVIRYGVVAACFLSIAVWFNTRLSAVEFIQVEQKTDLKYIKESVDRIEQRQTRSSP